MLFFVREEHYRVEVIKVFVEVRTGIIVVYVHVLQHVVLPFRRELGEGVPV